MSNNRKVKCTASFCNWRGHEEDILQGINPFDASDTLDGCPECKGIETINYVCDEPGCWEPISCGTPTSEGYRQTCGEHIQSRLFI